MMNDRDDRLDTAPLDTRRAVKKNKKVSGPRPQRWIYRVIVILALCAIAVLGWYNRNNLAPENVVQWVKSGIVGIGSGGGFPKTFSGSSVLPQNFFSSGKNIVFASDTSLTVCTPSGKELLNNQHSYSSPAVCAGGSHILLYDIGGKEYQLDTVGGASNKKSSAQNIIGGDAAPNGAYALISTANGYCGMLTSYLPSGKTGSYYWFSDYYPTAVALNPEGTRAAVTGVSASGGDLVSAVYIIDLSSGKTTRPETVSGGNLLSAVFWDTENEVDAVGDKSALILNPFSGAKSEYSYDGSKLTSYGSDGGRLALGLMPYEGSEKQKFVVLSKTGTPACTHQFSSKIRSVSLFGQTAAVLTEQGLYFVSVGSGSAAQCPAGSDACAVAMKDESSAYVLGISEIRIVRHQ